MKKRTQHFFSVAVVALFILIAFGSEDDKKSEDSNATEIDTLSNNATNPNEDVKKTDEQLMAQLKREIESLDKGIDFSKYKESVESIQIELVLFSAWAINIDEASKSENQEINP